MDDVTETFLRHVIKTILSEKSQPVAGYHPEETYQIATIKNLH